MLERLPEGVAVLCTTATANDRVVADVAEQLRLGHAGALRTYRGPLGARVAAAGGRRAARAGRPARVAGDAPAGAAGLRDRLHAHQARRRARSPSSSTATAIAAEAYSGEVDTERRVDGRGAAAAQRAQGRRGDQRAGHGLRQARPRVRRALPGARLGHLLLPAGRPRGARDRARRRRAAARRRGPPDPGLLHRAGVPAAGPRRARAGGAETTARRRTS